MNYVQKSSWIQLEPCLLNYQTNGADHHRKSYLSAIVNNLQQIKFNVQKVLVPIDKIEEKEKTIKKINTAISAAEHWKKVLANIHKHSPDYIHNYYYHIDQFCIYKFPECQQYLKALVDEIEALGMDSKTVDFYNQLKNTNSLYL
jgi:hypothetical protein